MQIMQIPLKRKKILNWKAKLNIDDMCRDIWNWQEKIQTDVDKEI